ncbi:hypothetical protein [Ktedonosporobacter rubrisoli]|nr:hypothetical protein [Ktedonosporobacter rubrisoli]
MLLTTYQEAAPFLQQVQARLEKQEVRNNLLLGISFGSSSH